jgi:hypothetical protein
LEQGRRISSVIGVARLLMPLAVTPGHLGFGDLPMYADKRYGKVALARNEAPIATMKIRVTPKFSVKRPLGKL